MKIENFSHIQISKVVIEDLGDITVEEYMQGYLDDDNIVVYDHLWFWL